MINRTKRKISLFNFLVILFVSAGVIVFFVNNIISVNALVVENDALLTEIKKAGLMNSNLQTETERLSNFDNIKGPAVDMLNLSFPQTRPKGITVQKSELDRLNN